MRGFNKVTKEFTQFRRPARQVHDWRTMLANPVADAVRRRFVHHFGPPRRGVHVAMAAGLVALSADVELQRLQTRPTKRPMMLGQLLFKAVHESKGMISRSDFYSISIPPGQKPAPVGLGIHVLQLAQQLNAQAGLLG